MKNVLKIVGIIILLIALAGIYKFNFTNDDIYVQQPGGEVVKYDESIVGKWQSVDDEKSVVVYSGDSTIIDFYDEQEMSTGTWSITTREDGVVLLTNTVDGERYEYSVVNVSTDSLELTYLARGNTLRYSRVVAE